MSDSDSTEDGASTTESTGIPGSFYGGGIEPSDTGPNGCGEECDIWNEDACPEGEKCTAASCAVGSTVWDTNVCRAIHGNAQVGDECEFLDGDRKSGEDTCAPGSICWNLADGAEVGVCLAFCDGSFDAPGCGDGSMCVIGYNGVLPLCRPECDPLEQDCEDPEASCYPTFGWGEQGYFCTYDASEGAGGYGESCLYINSCSGGFVCAPAETVPEPECISGESAGCCSPFCSLSSGEACPGEGQTCEPFFEPQPSGYEDVGVCKLPN